MDQKLREHHHSQYPMFWSRKTLDIILYFLPLRSYLSRACYAIGNGILNIKLGTNEVWLPYILPQMDLVSLGKCFHFNDILCGFESYLSNICITYFLNVALLLSPRGYAGERFWQTTLTHLRWQSYMVRDSTIALKFILRSGDMGLYRTLVCNYIWFRTISVYTVLNLGIQESDWLKSKSKTSLAVLWNLFEINLDNKSISNEVNTFCNKYYNIYIENAKRITL